MPTLSKIREYQAAPYTAPAAVLDEGAWQAWRTKGRLQEERRADTRLEALKVVSIVGLFAATALWSFIGPYEVALRFSVASAAIVVMLPVFRSRHYTLAVLLGAVALLYNPVVPLFTASGDLQRVLLVIAAAPFIASLKWWDGRKPR